MPMNQTPLTDSTTQLLRTLPLNKLKVDDSETINQEAEPPHSVPTSDSESNYKYNNQDKKLEGSSTTKKKTNKYPAFASEPNRLGHKFKPQKNKAFCSDTNSVYEAQSSIGSIGCPIEEENSMEDDKFGGQFIEIVDRASRYWKDLFVCKWNLVEKFKTNLKAQKLINKGDFGETEPDRTESDEELMDKEGKEVE